MKNSLLILPVVREIATGKAIAQAHEVARLRAAEAADIAAAAGGGAPIGDGYWKRRWAAEQRLAVLVGLLEAMEDPAPFAAREGEGYSP